MTARLATQPRFSRVWVLFAGLLLIQTIIGGRLFYWQILKGKALTDQAQAQYNRTNYSAPIRGSIFTRDGYELVGTTENFRVYLVKDKQTNSANTLSTLLAPLLAPTDAAYVLATSSAQKQELTDQWQKSLEDTITTATDKKWITLAGNVDRKTHEALEKLALPELAFEDYPARSYPEASMAAQVLGFVAKNSDGEDTGYFGIEGELDKELRGTTAIHTEQTDALGHVLLGTSPEDTFPANGRNVHLSLRRDVQHILESELARGMEKYAAKSGEIIVMEPQTGKVLGMAASPVYSPRFFYAFPQEWYKNTSLANAYEPGSTFKVLTIAAGIDAGVITPETQCPLCDGPRSLDKYTIRTWNNQYNPNITMMDALAKSDNTAMMYVADQLGSKKFEEYLQKFGVGVATGIELHEDTATAFPEKWGPVELATRSFGQGIQVNSVQLLSAVSAIANNGMLMRPSIIDKVVDPVSHTEIPIEPESERQVVSPETAQKVAQMMEYAASKGEAQWTASKTYPVAGKTGTSQIPEAGGYAADKTIASFVGFTPVENPRYVMLVKLVEPQSSLWSAETAAPLWYNVANKLQLLSW